MDRTNITFHHLPILKTAETVRGSGPFTIETAAAELAMLLFCEGRWSVASDSFCRVAEAAAMFLFNLYSKLDSQDDRHMMVEQMLEYIHTHLSGHLSIQEIAQYAGLSEPYCCNLFKKEKETTIVHYINQLRVEKAKEYIRHGAIPFKDAAAMVGIQNYTYFIRLFKQYTGMSPSEYR